MHPKMYAEYERILTQFAVTGSILEVGATPKTDCLLMLPCLRNAKERVGINLDGPWDHEGVHIVGGNANDMHMFGDARFDLVLCNAVLEHDPYFWRSVAEMTRVLKPGGTLFIGVPGYTVLSLERLKRPLKKLPVVGPFFRYQLGSIIKSTLTHDIHSAPGDYYRFSPEAVQTVLFEGYRDVQVRSILVPPRLIGYGTKA
jgi:SAM-dependent methyltransferase